MTHAREIWRTVIGHNYDISTSGGQIVIEKTPFSRRLPQGTIGDLKAHKSELLALFAFEEWADRLLVESSRKLAECWPPGCVLKGGEWDALDQRLHEAYLAEEEQELREVIVEREKQAEQIFNQYRKEQE